MKQFKTIRAYIATFPSSVQMLLKKMRSAISEAAPEAEEAIRYGMPTFRLNGNLVHFAAFKDHVSLFPGSGTIRAFQKDLVKFQTSKGTIQFPYGMPIPFVLVKKMVRFRVRQNKAKK